MIATVDGREIPEISSDEYHKRFAGSGMCFDCGTHVGLGGPNGETYGWASVHLDWHRSQNPNYDDIFRDGA